MNADQKNLPPGWVEKRFGEITRIANGQVNPIEEPYSKYFHIGPENIESASGFLNPLKTAEELGLVSGKYLFDKDSIVYSKIRPNLNKLCLPEFTGICSADMYPVWPETEIVNKSFLFYYMKSPMFLKQVIPASMRTGLPKVNRNDLKRVKVRFPALVSDQKEIAKTIAFWDKLIPQTQLLINAKTELKRGLMQRLLTGNQRLPEFTQPWVRKRMDSLFRQRIETGLEHLSLIAITGKDGIMDRDKLNRKDTSSADKSKYLRICPGDIGYNTMRMWQGVSALSDREGIISPAYTVCTPKSGTDGLFMAYLLKLPRVVNLFYRYSQGLTSDTWNLKFPHFSEVKVSIPEDINEQKAIAKILQDCDSEIKQLQNKLTLLKEQKRGLMQKLLTGEWRLPVPEQPLPQSAEQAVTVSEG